MTMRKKTKTLLHQPSRIFFTVGQSRRFHDCVKDALSRFSFKLSYENVRTTGLGAPLARLRPTRVPLGSTRA